MSEETKDKDLVAHQSAVQDYLSALLLEPEQEQAASVSRAVENIVGLMAETTPSEAQLDEDEVAEDTTITEQTDCIDESSLQHEIEPVHAQVETLEGVTEIEQDDEVSEEASSLSVHETIDDGRPDEIEDEDESLEIHLDIPDCSNDPEVIAEAEKMLSFVFPQPQAEINTPLRKLQDAGIIKVSAELETSLEVDTPEKVAMLGGENAFKNDAPAQLVPSFASDRFTVMGFRVSRLNMMVSVTELRNVKKPDGELLPIFGKPSWLLEYRKPEGGTAFVVDGTELFVPEGAAKILSSKLEDLYIIWMLDGRLGILCDEVQEMTELNKRQVTWRGSKSQRPWLAGTIRSMRSVLIDGESLWEMVDSQFK